MNINYDFISMILAIVSLIVAIIGVMLIIRQLYLNSIELKTSTQVFKAQNIQYIRSLLLEIDDDLLYTIPRDIVYTKIEFTEPPPVSGEWHMTEEEKAVFIEAKTKRDWFFESNDKYNEYKTAFHGAINALNDIAQIIENDMIDMNIVFAQWHMKIIKIIHIVEAYRCRQNGVYGQRLLRLRKSALDFHRKNSKHNKHDIIISFKNGQEDIVLYDGKK